jgi:hypothetical protein
VLGIPPGAQALADGGDTFVELSTRGSVLPKEEKTKQSSPTTKQNRVQLQWLLPDYPPAAFGATADWSVERFRASSDS